MTRNNFQLHATVSTAHSRRWTYYHPAAYLDYKSAAGEIATVKLRAYGRDHRSPRLAESYIPALLRDRAAYYAAVAAAADQLVYEPVAVYKVMRLRCGTLRSLRLSQICYHMGELHAHPVVPEWNLGIHVLQSLEDALGVLDAEMRQIADEYAIVRCFAAPPVELNGRLVTAAILPVGIVHVSTASKLRAVRGTSAAWWQFSLQRWDDKRLRWQTLRRTLHRDDIINVVRRANWRGNEYLYLAEGEGVGDAG